MIVVAFLVPLSVYCLILGTINRRRRPLMVSAAWDFAGLLFAASGFLAFGLPGLLNGFTERGRHAALFGRPASGGGAWAWLADLFDGLCATLFSAGHGTVLVAYFVLVVAGSAYVLWRRSSQTAVYNVHPEVLDEVLAGVLDAAGLSWSRAGNRYFIARPKGDKPPAERRGAYPASAEDIERSTYLEVEPAPGLCHATLRWETDDTDLRSQVEAELAGALAGVRTEDNPTGVWLMTAGIVLLLSAALVFGLVVLHKLFIER